MMSRFLLVAFSVAVTAFPCAACAQSERYPVSPITDEVMPDSTNPRVARLDYDRNANSGTEREGFFEATRIVARVAGEPIFVGDLMGDVNRQIERAAPTAPDYIKEQSRPRLMKQMLPMAIEQKLIYIDMSRSMAEPSRVKALRKNITDQFDKLQLPRLMEELEVGSRDDLDAKLRGYDSSLRALREKWVDNQVVAIYVQQMISSDEHTISRQEMLEEYNRNKDDYHFPSRVRWEEIMVSYTRVGGKEEAWEKIAEMGNKVIYGASLAEVAKTDSHGYRAKEGGQQDWTTAGSVKHEQIDKLLFELPVNFLSDIIETEQGYHIIRVLERKDEGYVSFAEAQQKIKARIQKDRKKNKLSEYLEKLKREIPVEIYDEDVAKAFLKR